MSRFYLFPSIVFIAAALLVGCGAAQQDNPQTETAPHNSSEQGLTFEGDFDGPLGLQLWSLRNYFKDDVSGTLAKVYEMGFREVELAGTYGMSAEAFRQELEKAGLKATSMHAGYNEFDTNLEGVLDDAETLGADYVGLAWIPHPEDQPYTVEMARKTAAKFNKWGKAARERGITFFYHTHGFEFQAASDGTVPFDVLMQETDSENVKYEMDVLWVTRPGADPAKLLRKYPDRWVLMHIKDLKKGASTNDHSGHAPPEEEVAVGRGQIDFQEVLEAAEEIGLKRYYVEDETMDPVGNIPNSLKYLQTVTY